MEILGFTLYFINLISVLIAGYCFARILLYPVLKFIIGEKKLYSDPKLENSMEYFYAFGLCPLKNWTDEKRTEWINAWWKYALFGLISFAIGIIALYILDKYY
ncbi:MAG: hypothetical protein GY705_30215 [Bacteroidetes bacterium]|nr:hypothetical protein [Bacteroidota bacterium]